MKTEEKLTKPLTMAMRELRIGIESAITGCGLPACIVEPIVCTVWLQLKASAEAQERAEAAVYGKENVKREETP